MALATIFKNPDLTDYFVPVEDVRLGRPAPSIVEQYEAGKVVSFPNLKLDIDHEFWASLPTDAYPALKKTNGADDSGKVLRAYMERVGIPERLAARLHRETEHVLDQVRPIYEQLFAGYRFTRRKVAWRLNTIMNENLHVDAYREPNFEHFARVFINLDNQPRVWKTSFTLEELYERYGEAALAQLGPDADANALQAKLNHLAFGPTSRHWWDNQPRHVAYFAPGDVWAVDSRLVSHQIFYGRRAVSLDFFVDPASMRNSRRQYLAMGDEYLKSHALA